MPGTLHLIRKGDCRHDQCRRNCMMHRRSVLQKARLEDRHAIGFRLISPSIIVRPGPNSPWGHDVRVPKGNGRRSFPRTRYPSGPFRKTRMIYRERSAPIPFDRRDRNPRKSVRSRNRFIAKVAFPISFFGGGIQTFGDAQCQSVLSAFSENVAGFRRLQFPADVGENSAQCLGQTVKSRTAAGPVK